MPEIAQSARQRLRPVAVRFGIVGDGGEDRFQPPTLRSVMRTIAPIAALLGIAIAVRRTPIEGPVWATLTVAAAGWAVAAHRWVNGHRTATSAVVDFLRIAPLYMILFTAGSLAWNASDPVGDALSWGLMAGTISGSVSAVVDWRDRRQALR